MFKTFSSVLFILLGLLYERSEWWEASHVTKFLTQKRGIKVGKNHFNEQNPSAHFPLFFIKRQPGKSRTEQMDKKKTVKITQ